MENRRHRSALKRFMACHFTSAKAVRHLSLSEPILAGSQSRPTTFTERWTFALDGDARQPWLLTAVGGTVPQA